MSLLFLYCLLLPLSICLSVSPASLYLSLLPRIALSVCHLLDVYYYSIFSLFACLPACSLVLACAGCPVSLLFKFVLSSYIHIYNLYEVFVYA